jgi:glycosyltransferase involved in cell wall biosynthesis
MRILHLVLAPRLSGAEVLAKDLAIHQQQNGEVVGMTALMPQHDDFTVLRAALGAGGVECMFPDEATGTLGKLWHLYRTVRHYRPDVMFAHATIPAFYARALPIDVPVVYVMHSATNDFERNLFRRIERVLSRRARAVIAVSPANIDDYVAAVGRHPSMRLIPNGVDMARFSHGLTIDNATNAALIVQIGRYTSVKNQLQTVHAFSEVVERVPFARLQLCGVIEDPAYYVAVKDLVDKLASVFAMPSRSEGHSIAFLEALASGVPIVASDIRPFAFARDFPAVHLLDPEDTHLYAKSLVVALGERRAQRPLSGLTLADTAERYLEVAHQVTRRMANVPA